MNALRKKNIGSIARAYWQPLVLLALLLLILAQTYSWAIKYVELRKVDTLIIQTEDLSITGDQKTANQPPQPPQQNNPVKPDKNIFKKENINYQLSAIYMDKAVINGKDYKAGDKIGNATLIEIGVFHAKIQEEGKSQPRTLELFKGGGAEMVSPSGAQPAMANGPGNSRPPSSPTNIQRSERAGGMGMGLRRQNFSQEERRQMAERYRNMSPDQQMRFREEMRARLTQ
jgi:hypothetical protein